MRNKISSINYLLFSKLLNNRFRIVNSSRGYTLVELLAVTSIIVIVSGLIVGVLYSTLRGGNKSRVTNDVSQSGNFALSVISNTALLAESVTEIDGAPVVDCTDKIESKSIKFKQSDGSEVSFSCDQENQSIASISGETTVQLVDVNSVQVDYDTCSFTCFQSNDNPYSLPIIGISFTASQRGSTSGFENVSQSVFKTSVTMRNFSPK